MKLKQVIEIKVKFYIICASFQFSQKKKPEPSHK